jgi:short-subunit dehydrogenase
MHILRGKRVLITGGAQGIGRATALRCAREGAALLLADLKVDALPAVAEEIRQAGGTCASFRLDVTDPESILRLRDEVHAQGGPIDVLINNAGTVFGGAFLDVPLAKHYLTYQVNTLGLVGMTHAFLPDLLRGSDAHLVNIASAAAFVGLPYGSTYGSSKWSVLGFSEAMRLELADLGHTQVHVTAICPSVVGTGLFNGAQPPKTTQILKPDELAEAIVRGMLKNRPIVCAPALVNTTATLRGILSTRWFDRACRFFGANTAMLHWRGHDNPQARHHELERARLEQDKESVV